MCTGPWKGTKVCHSSKIFSEAALKYITHLRLVCNTHAFTLMEIRPALWAGGHYGMKPDNLVPELCYVTTRRVICCLDRLINPLLTQLLSWLMATGSWIGARQGMGACPCPAPRPARPRAMSHEPLIIDEFMD